MLYCFWSESPENGRPRFLSPRINKGTEPQGRGAFIVTDGGGGVCGPGPNNTGTKTETDREYLHRLKMQEDIE